MDIFALNATQEFGRKVAVALGVELAAHEEREFEDGEHKARPLASVRGHNVYVIQSLHSGPEGSVNDRLCRLLFFISALKENGASRVTAVVPYLAYSRKDRQTKSRDPVTTRYIARLFEAAGVDLIMTLEAHNIVAYQNAFRCQTIHLDPRRLFARGAVRLVGDAPVVVVSPDPGGVKRAQLFRETLEVTLEQPVGSAFLEKRRSAGAVTGELVAGEVEGATVLVIDDLISTGGTLARAAKACREYGAEKVIAFAAHGLFVGDASDVIRQSGLAQTLITDTVPPFQLAPDLIGQKVRILSAATLFADAIRCCEGEGSITELLEGPE